MTRLACLLAFLACNSSWSSAFSLVQVNAHFDRRRKGGLSALNDLYVWTSGNATHTGALVAATGFAHKARAPEVLPATRGGGIGDYPPAVHPATKAKDNEWLETYPEFHLVIPSAKLAFCHSPKVASAQFAWMFNRANDIDTDKDFFYKFLLSTPERQHVDVNTITKRQGWKFAYFTRDPLDRYLSAFGSKCLFNSEGFIEGDGRDCGGKFFQEPASKEEIIEAFEKRVWKDAERGQPSKNIHWRRQSEHLAEFCGKMFTPKTADFVGTLSKDMNSQVKQMLRMTNMTNAQIDALTDEFFPKDVIKGHHSDMSKQEFFRNGSVVRALEKLYESDYKKLGIRPFHIWH